MRENVGNFCLLYIFFLWFEDKIMVQQRRNLKKGKKKKELRKNNYNEGEEKV